MTTIALSSGSIGISTVGEARKLEIRLLGELAILADGESYGYAIIQQVRELSKGELEWSDGMLYPVLHGLEKNDFIPQVNDIITVGEFYEIAAGGQIIFT